MAVPPKPTAPQPVAQGDLQNLPLVHVVASLHRKGSSGTLVIWDESGAGAQERVLFASGRPVAARGRSTSALLPLFEALADRAAGAFAFYAEDLVGAEATTSAVAPAPLIRAMVHSTRRTDGLERVLAARGDALLRVKRGTTAAQLALEGQEAELLDVLRAAPATAAQFPQRSGRPEMARRLLYLLELNGVLEQMELESPARAQIPTPTPTPTSTPTSTRIPKRTPTPTPGQVQTRTRAPSVTDRAALPARPEGLSDADRARWDEIVTHTEAEDGRNHYEVLGVEMSASVQEIDRAYVRLAKLAHPDRLGHALALLKPQADALFRRATAARDVLTDAAAREAYDQEARQGGGTPAAERHVQRVVEAALEYQKVDLLLKKKSFDEALSILDRNLELSPDVADYPAKKAYALLLSSGAAEPESRRRILALLDLALQLDPRHEAAHFTKGQVLKRAGDTRAALAHFRAAAQTNPHNIDAAREVRLASIHKGEGEAPEGLLKRLFKKKS